MENLRAKIIEAALVGNLPKFERLIKSNIQVNTGDRVSRNINLEGYTTAQMEISLPALLKGLDECLNGVKKAVHLQSALQTINAIFGTLQYELDELDLMTLYTLRNNGKFRLRESDLMDKVAEEFMHFPKFKMNKDDFHDTLMTLKNDGFISLRRKNVLIEENLVCVIELQ